MLILSCSLQIDLLPEIVEAPCILSEVDAALKAKQMKNDVDEYLMVLLFFTLYLFTFLGSSDYYIRILIYSFCAVEATEFNFSK